MRRGFILPIVMILMVMLMGMSLVLSRIAEDKTGSLEKQKGGYYSENGIAKKITIEVIKPAEEE